MGTKGNEWLGKGQQVGTLHRIPTQCGLMPPHDSMCWVFRLDPTLERWGQKPKLLWMTEPMLQTMPRQDPAMCPVDFKFGLRLKLFPHFQPSPLCLGRCGGYLCSRPTMLAPHSMLPGKGSGTRGVSWPLTLGSTGSASESS